MANDVRADTTFIGLFLIGFVLLMFGVLGLQLGNLFGDVAKDLPIDGNVFGLVVGAIGMIMIVLSVFAYRTGGALPAGVFAFTGAFFIFYYMNGVSSNSNWFLFIAVAIFYLIFAIYALMQKAPKFLTALLVIVALVVFFFGLAFYFSAGGPGANVDAFKGLTITAGIFAFLGFIVAVYLGLAFANPKKIPLI